MIDSREHMQSIKDRNFNTVCGFMKDCNDVTIGRLSQLSGFSLPTVAKIIGYGIEIGVFEKSKSLSYTGGRNAQNYHLNRRYCHCAYFSVNHNGVAWRVLNFADEVVSSGERTCNNSEAFEEICSRTEEFTKSFTNLNLCVLSMPCVVRDGVIIDWGGYPGAVGLDIAKAVKERCGVETIVENDMKILAASADKYLSQGAQGAVAAYSVGEGFYGLGTAVEGRILSGKNSFAGEVSYMPFGLDGTIEDISVKILASTVVFISPAAIIFYDDTGADIMSAVAEKVKGIIPAYAVPEFIKGKNMEEDLFDGLISLTASRRLITGCK